MSEWKKVKIGDFLTESKVLAEESDAAHRITVRLNCKGVEKRGLKAEKEGATKYYTRYAGQFIYGKQNIHKGAFGIIPSELDGYTSSADLPAFDIDESKCVPEWIPLSLKVDERYKTLQKEVKGVGSQRLAVNVFLNVEIPLPEVSIQREILAKVGKKITSIALLDDEIEKQKNYVKQLRQNILQEAIEGKLTEDLPCRQAGWRKNSFRNLSGKLVPKESDKYFAYVLECNNGSLYKGYTRNLFERINRHLEERGAEWTAKHTPVSLIHFEEFNKEKEALEREKYFKSGFGREYINEIRNHNKLEYDAEALFEKIQEEKCHTNSKKKVFEPIAENELPFEIPEGWKWVRLGEIIKDSPRNGYSPKAVDFETPIKTLKLGAVTYGIFDASEFKYINEEIPKDAHCWLKNGDILIERSNSIEYVGICAIYTGKDDEFMYPDLLMRFRTSDSLSKEYIHKVLVSPFNRQYFMNNAKGSQKTMPKINQETVSNTLIPLPPLAEQKEIVSRVEKLLANVTELEKQITEREEMTKQLMQSIMKDAFREE